MNIPAYITDLGDSAVLGAIALATTLFFLFNRCPREAAAMALSFIGAGAVIAFLKISFLSCGQNFLGIQSPSGHAALSVSVLGAYGLVLTRGSKGGLSPVLLPILLSGFGLLIALTRVSLGYHSVSEVILGTITGLAVMLAIKIWVLKPGAAPRGEEAGFNIPILVALTLLAAFLVYGKNLPVEGKIRQVAERVKVLLSGCP